MKNNLLAGLSTQQFLHEYWQKKPLLIRQAIPGFKGFLNQQKMTQLACQEDVQSRLVQFKNEWTLNEGPFNKSDLKKLQGHWTLLVQGINYLLPEGDALLKKFNFIPYARLDDLMVSFAPDQGGVGPHFDSYDVFLLQGPGRRRWQISKQKDLRLVPNIPLKILKNFKPTEEYVLESGDMLYLPPNYAHNGIAEGDCMTYSIGFRAPHYQEIISEFLIYLQDHLKIEGIYQDPDIKATKQPARIPSLMMDKVSAVLNKINYNKNDIEIFWGKYLTEPKAHIFFDSPDIPLAKQDFIKSAKKHGIQLNIKTNMLYTTKMFFINGEVCSFNTCAKDVKQLADKRSIDGSSPLVSKMGDFLYECYLNGYLEIKL